MYKCSVYVLPKCISWHQRLPEELRHCTMLQEEEEKREGGREREGGSARAGLSPLFGLGRGGKQAGIPMWWAVQWFSAQQRHVWHMYIVNMHSQIFTSFYLQSSTGQQATRDAGSGGGDCSKASVQAALWAGMRKYQQLVFVNSIVNRTLTKGTLPELQLAGQKLKLMVIMILSL